MIDMKKKIVVLKMKKLKIMQLKIPLKKKQLHFMFMKDGGVLPQYIYTIIIYFVISLIPTLKLFQKFPVKYLAI